MSKLAEKELMPNNCIFCNKKHTPEYMQSIQFYEEHNLWDHIESVLPVLKKIKNREWNWARNTACKYIDIRIDMRDGGCIIKDREGNRISPSQLLWQYSKETPEKITDAEAYKNRE